MFCGDWRVHSEPGGWHRLDRGDHRSDDGLADAILCGKALPTLSDARNRRARYPGLALFVWGKGLLFGRLADLAALSDSLSHAEKAADHRGGGAARGLLLGGD